MNLSSKKIEPRGLSEALNQNFVGASRGYQMLISESPQKYPQPKHLLARQVRILNDTIDCDYQTEEFEDSFLLVEYYGPQFIEDAMKFYKRYGHFPDENELFQIYSRGIENVVDLPF